MAPPSGGSPDIQLPAFVNDPVWALAPWPVTVELGATQWQIPALPAADWLMVLMQNPLSLSSLLPGLLDEHDVQSFTDALVDGEEGFEDLTQVCQDLVATVSARPWYVALRLISVAAGSWDNIGGELVLRGVDAQRLSLAAWLDAAYLVMLRSMKQESITMWLLKLELPPPQVGGEEQLEAEPEMSRDAFMGLMQ